jgi:hypothetical protein
MFCPDCGSEVAEGRKFCGKCGGQIHAAAGSIEATQGAAPQQTAAPAPRQPASPRQKLIYVLVALLVVLGGVAWWWFHRPAPAYQVKDPGIYPFQGLSPDGKAMKWGFIDAEGKVLIPPQWDGISLEMVSDHVVVFNEGLGAIAKNGKWGYIDTGGNLVIPTQFDLARPFFGGVAMVKLGNQVGYIDKTGQYIINPQFSDGGDFRNGLAAVHGDGGWGFINKAGAFVIAPHFTNASDDGFSDGLAVACPGTGKCGYIDRAGKFAIRSQFDSATSFSEGMAAVKLDNRWGYVNSAGKIVINPQFDAVTSFFGGLAVVSVSGQTGTINQQGKFVVNPGQYKIQLTEGSDLQPASTSDGMGLISRDGKWVVQPSKALTGFAGICGKVFYGTIASQLVPIDLSGRVLAGTYKNGMLGSLAQDIDNEISAIQSMHTLTGAEASYNTSYPAKGFTASIAALGPATGTPDENHASFIAADLATGTKDNYQFTISIPEGTSTGGTNFNYFIVAKPTVGHTGRSFCADSSGALRYVMTGDTCSVTSPTLGD